MSRPQADQPDLAMEDALTAQANAQASDAQAQSEVERCRAELLTIEAAAAQGTATQGQKTEAAEALWMATKRAEQIRDDLVAAEVAVSAMNREFAANQTSADQEHDEATLSADLEVIREALDAFSNDLRSAAEARRTNFKALRANGAGGQVTATTTGYSVRGKPVQSFSGPAITSLLQALVPVLRLSEAHVPLSENLRIATQYQVGLPRTPNTTKENTQ